MLLKASDSFSHKKMVKPSVVLALAASDMNDTAQTTYTEEAMLPYLNMALLELNQVMQENNIPITDKHSTPILVTAGITEIPFHSTTQTVLLPPDLVDVEKLWESDDGGNTWTPMSRVDEIDPNLLSPSTAGVNIFGTYEWLGDMIRVPLSTNDITLKIDYIRNIINAPIPISAVGVPLRTDAILFLTHKTGALCAQLSAQDETRAAALIELAEQAIERELNIPTKGRQQIATRRRPFRSAYKSYGRTW